MTRPPGDDLSPDADQPPGTPETPGAGPTPKLPRSSSVGRASALLASGTIVSRILGFASAAVLAQTLGTQSVSANTFTLANQLPNNIYAIVAGGLLSAILVPQIVRAGLHNDGGQKFINRIVTLGAVVFIAAALVATLCAPLLVRLYAQQSNGSGGGFTPAEIALATAFAYWCLPQILFYALYSLLGEVLNARGLFGPFTWAPVVNNLVAITGLLTFLLLFGSQDGTDAADWGPGMIALIAGTATLGVAAQASVLFLFWRRAGLSYRPEFHWRGVGLGRVGKAAGWTFAMIVVTQLAGIVQVNIASLAARGDPGIAVLRYAWLMFMLPHSIVAVSIATAYFTRMSGHARDGLRAEVRHDVSGSLRSIGLIMVIAAAVLLVVSYPFAAVFATGFDHVQAMGNVLIAFVLGLVPFSIMFVLQRTFYALEDTRTPFFIQVAQSVLFVLGALLVPVLLPQDLLAFGIAAVTTLAGLAQMVIAALVLRRRTGGFDGRHVVRQYGVFLLAALPAAAAGVPLAAFLGAYSDGFAVSGIFPAMVSMILIGAVMLLVYLVALVAVRNPELRTIVAPIGARLRRR